ncbi:MAG: class I SAM-dependent methyltransferase [Vicinamibacterales bacterium]
MITPYGLRALMKWMATRGEIPRYQDAYASLDRCFRSRRDPWNFETDAYHAIRFDTIIDVIRRVPHRSILDVGCAEGHLTRRLCGVGEHVVAIDVSPTAAARARETAVAAEVIYATLGKVEFDRTFDLVLCSEMIYYATDPVAAVRKLNSLGHFVLVTYTSYEGDRLDRIFARIPVLHRAACRYLRLFDAGKVVNRHGCRIVLWWSGALSEDVLQSMQAESRRGARERAPSGSRRLQTRRVQ